MIFFTPIMARFAATIDPNAPTPITATLASLMRSWSHPSIKVCREYLELSIICGLRLNCCQIRTLGTQNKNMYNAAAIPVVNKDKTC